MKYIMKIVVATFVIIAIIFTRDAASQFKFENATNAAKINQTCQTVTDLGGGVIVIDYDNDGWEDLYLPGGAQLDKLYKNMGDGTFKDVTDPIFAKHNNLSSYTQGGTAFDYDKDGYKDIFEACKRKDLLWRNRGDGTFINYSQPANIVAPLEENASHGASFGDVDGDGDNDMYVARWIWYLKEDTDPHTGNLIQTLKGFENHFYINNNNGTFTERGREFAVNDSGTTNIALFFDFDKDGDLDIFSGNDYGMNVLPNHVYKNLMAETGIVSFVEVAKELGLDAELYTMTVTPNDFDRDRKFNIYNTSIGGEFLFKEEGGIYKSVAKDIGLPEIYDSTGGAPPISWATVFTDFDNDGWDDMYVQHGYLPLIIGDFASNIHDTSRFYHSNQGTFTDVTLTDGVIFDGRGRGATSFDYDKDGRMDIVIGSVNVIPGVNTKDYQVFRNVTPYRSDRNWIQIGCKAIRTAPEAIGTTIEVWENGVCHMRQVTTGGGMVSCASLIQHFGIGSATVIDSVVLYWPMTKDLYRQVDRYYNVQANQRIFYTQAIENTTVTNEIEETNISVYPSIASSVITIRGMRSDEDANYEIITLLGQKIAEFSGRKNEVELPISSLTPGQYFVKVSTATATRVLKFIKIAQ